MRWQETEQKAFEWYKENYDTAAEKCGGSNSTVSDIYSPQNGFYIEVKQITPTQGARAGQFTESKIAESAVAAMLAKDETNQELIKEFVKEHYTKKKVGQFIIFNGLKFTIYTVEEFLDSFDFSLEIYEKRSGSSKLAKKYYKDVLNYSNSFIQTDAGIISNDSATYGTCFEIGSNQFYIDYSGLIKKRSNSINKTWQVNVNQRKNTQGFFQFD